MFYMPTQTRACHTDRLWLSESQLICHNHGMDWQRTLQTKTRDPAFLWRMVIAIIAVGIVLGWLLNGVASSVMQPLLSLDAEEHWQRLAEFAANDQWSRVWWGIPKIMLKDLRQPGIIAIALLSAVCWLVFLWQVLRVRSPLDWRVPATLAGVVLGVLSVWPTLFFIFWQEVRWGLDESAELVPGLRFFILGVGLREELAKLLCLLPLMAVLVPKRDEAAALIVSASVGLGFALEENLGYYLGSQGGVTLGRFLTANPFHMAMTGLIGLHVYRALIDPKNWAPQALAVFGVLVFAHGAYDALAVLPQLNDLSFFSIVVFALVTYQYFHELRTLRPAGRDIISLSATFLFCVSLITAVTFVYISAVVSNTMAVDALFGDIISLAVMVYLFLREMPETMVRV
jgi:RsiW-degrading membrane proteinase PrsW (M82 family)